METKEYIVILHTHTDLDDFYTDMEQQGHREYAPNRAVELVRRRPMSCSTHYQLTDAEVQTLKQDPRVKNVIEPYYSLGIKIVPCDTQNSDYWSKGGSERIQGNPQVNWGLLRCVEGKTRDNWGRDRQPYAKGTVNLPNTGRNVDVVIVDGHIDPGHPEFAVNDNGTGDSRVIQYKWFKEHALEVLGYMPSKIVNGVSTLNDYEYDFPQEGVFYNNHGASAAGIAAGNTHGFARGANIYNINPYGDATNTGKKITVNGEYCDIYTVIDFIAAFHKNKKINEVTNRRNPTIANMSFLSTYAKGYGYNAVREIQYKGETITRPNSGWLGDEFRKAGYSEKYYQRDDSMDQDIIRAIAAGVIFVGTAGNDMMYMDRPGSDLYDSSLVAAVPEPDGSYNKTYYMRGPSPGAAPGVICVGAVDCTVEERNSSYSGKGPRVDIYAPADGTMSARNTYSGGVYEFPSVTSPPGGPTYILSYPTSVNEGDSLTVTVNTTGVASGTRLAWEIKPEVDSNGIADRFFDFVNVLDSSFAIGSDGRGTFTVPIRADMWTEGPETFVLRIRNSSFEYVATTNPITIVDTSRGDMLPPYSDHRNPKYIKYPFSGTSAAAPHVTGIIACALETYPNMTPVQALSYIQTYADRGLLTDIPHNSDYEADEWYKKMDDGVTINPYRLFNGPNMYVRYQHNTRPNQVQPAIGHAARPATGGVYPRTRITKS
jgi:hypothetical protein